MKSEHKLKAEILAASRDLESCEPGTEERIKALKRLTDLRGELGKLELQNLKEKNE